MKTKTLVPLIFTSLLALILASCTKSKTIGFDVENPLTTETTDTIKAIASTYLLDALPSSNTGLIMVGGNDDPAMGKLKISSYFRLKPPARSDFPKSAAFDSIRLVLKYSKYSYGDTAQLQQLAVYRLTEPIKLHKFNPDIEPEEKPVFIKDEDALFTSSTFKHEALAIGSHSYIPSPRGKDSLSIKIDQIWGRELFQMLVDKDNRLANADDFLDYLKGMYIETKTSAAVIGFNADDVRLVVYYHYQDDNGFPKNGNSVFMLHEKQYQFNHLSVDRQATNLKNLSKENPEIASIKTDQQVFLQGGSGLVTKIQLPGLTKFMQEPNIIVNKAELFIQTKPSSYKTYKAPSSLILLIANKANTPKFIVPNAFNTGTQEAMFSPGDDKAGLARYTFNLTEYANKIRKGEYKNTSLLLSLPIDDLIKTVNRLHVTNDKSTLSISTQIIYTKYK